MVDKKKIRARVTQTYHCLPVFSFSLLQLLSRTAKVAKKKKKLKKKDEFHESCSWKEKSVSRPLPPPRVPNLEN